MTEEDYAETLTRYARVDWVAFGNWDRLHNAIEFVADAHEWCYLDVLTACGLRRDRAFVPGIFTRTGAERCAHCCDRSGFPRGTGSPKNDDACRALVGLSPSSVASSSAGEDR